MFGAISVVLAMQSSSFVRLLLQTGAISAAAVSSVKWPPSYGRIHVAEAATVRNCAAVNPSRGHPTALQFALYAIHRRLRFRYRAHYEYRVPGVPGMWNCRDIGFGELP